VKITTHSDKSRGLDATYKGIINAENVIINTDGQSCAALATDRGEGEVHVKNSEINTGVSKDSGRGSPLIYSTGNITVDNTKGTAYVSQIACIEGKNSIEVTNSDLTGYGEGNRKDGDNYVLYDFYDKKVEDPSTLIKNAPNQKTLKEYSQTFYDENMIPIGTYRSGFYGNNGRYYPRRGFYPTGFQRMRTPNIVRPNNRSDFFKYADYKDNVNYVDTRYPKFHKFKY
jgi:hypothetical protein